MPLHGAGQNSGAVLTHGFILSFSEHQKMPSEISGGTFVWVWIFYFFRVLFWEEWDEPEE